MEKTKEKKLREIQGLINEKHGLYRIHTSDAVAFEEEMKDDGKSAIPIMTYGDFVIYLKADKASIPDIPLEKFNYTSGTFEKKWGPDHRTIVLTPNHSCIRKVELEIQGMDIMNMDLLDDMSGDVVEDMARVKITRHYRFSAGQAENKGDMHAASPGLVKARV